MSTPNTADQHAQLLYSMVAIMDKKSQLLEQYQKSKQLSKIKLECVKLPTNGVDQTNLSNSTRSKWSRTYLQE